MSVHTTVTDIFNRLVPIKKRYVRANQAPFINKVLSKEIMKRTRLRNNYLKNRSIANKMKYNKQRNFCVALLRREKKTFFNNLNTKMVVDNKRFWQTIKPLLSHKNRNKQD